MSPRPTTVPRFPRQALLSCGGCGDVFINWSRTATVCRKCGGADLTEIKWSPR